MSAQESLEPSRGSADSGVSGPPAVENIDSSVVPALQLWVTPDKHGGTGFSPFVQAGYKRAQGNPLRLLTAEMLEDRLLCGVSHDDPILNRRITEIFEGEEAAYKKEMSSWNGGTPVVSEFDTGGMGAAVQNGSELSEEESQPPLPPRERMLRRIAELRTREQQKATEIARKWRAQHGISIVTTENEPLTNSVESLNNLWESDGAPPAIYMTLDNVRPEQRNSSSDGMDFLEAYPGLQKLRTVLVESTYDWIMKTAPDEGTKQEYLRACVENGVSTILISTIIEPTQLKRAEDPPLLVDAQKLVDFQSAVKHFGASEAHCLTLPETQRLAQELEAELTASNLQGRNLATIPLRVTRGYAGLKAVLFTYESLVLREGRGSMHWDRIPWSDKMTKATLYGGVLAVCALTQILERQSGGIVESQY